MFFLVGFLSTVSSISLGYNRVVVGSNWDASVFSLDTLVVFCFCYKKKKIFLFFFGQKAFSSLSYGEQRKGF
jgi:hypothetical protein